jgi:hypothetical protein
LDARVEQIDGGAVEEELKVDILRVIEHTCDDRPTAALVYLVAAG